MPCTTPYRIDLKSIQITGEDSISQQFISPCDDVAVLFHVGADMSLFDWVKSFVALPFNTSLY